MKFKFDATGVTEFHEFMKQYPERLARVRRLLVRGSAQSVRDAVVSDWPFQEERSFIDDMFVVRDVDAANIDPMKQMLAAVVMKRSEVQRAVRETPEERTLLVVGRPNPRLQPRSEGIAILRAYNPWTPDTIPYIPPRNEARTSIRLVSKSNAQRIRNARNDQRPEVLSKLKDAGVRVPKDLTGNESAVMSEQTGGDIAQRSLQAEFGIGEKFMPHWRPALRNIGLIYLQEFLAQKDILRILFDPDYTKWDEAVKPIPRIGEKRVEELQEFQQKVTE